MTEFLSTEDLLRLTDDLGVGPVRDVGLIESAAHRPTTVLWGNEAYPSLDDKAAALFESLIRNHALVDGNTRLGWLALIVFSAINGNDLDVEDDEAYDFVIAVASGEKSLNEIARRFREWRGR
ncbi:type II toxin-antitoxin system death-on-curing family toxin [Brevibacterium samyangense]|uniref:Type II toxin-antitoxin system death-on-curing family toxin n=1 Tax=Brevibacterium samyangense TaxID=366888 RepID=A0ABP5ENN0_9MICO